MAATVEISETNGPSGSPTTTDGITSINFGGADLPNLVPSDHPLVMSNLAPSYSYTKWLQLHVSNMGGSTTINVLKVWKSGGPAPNFGAYVTQELLCSNVNIVNNASAIISAYATNIAGMGGGSVVTPYNGDGSAIAAPAWTTYPIPTSQPANENLQIGAGLAGSIVDSGGGVPSPAYSNFAALALKVDGSAGTPSGAVNQKVITFQYNES